MLTVKTVSELDQNVRAVTKILRVHNEMNPRSLTERMKNLTAEETDRLLAALNNLDRLNRSIGSVELRVVACVD